MKKTKLLTTLGAVALIGAIGIGSTFAYLTSETGTVKNTFTVGKVEIALKESAVTKTNGQYVDGDEANKWTVTENTYEDLIPGDVMVKDPTVIVKENEVVANVFVAVKLDTENGWSYDESTKKFTCGEFSTDAVTNDWKLYKATATEAVFCKQNVDSSEGDVALTLFNKVTYAASATEAKAPADLKIRAAAVQAGNINLDDGYAQVSGKLLAFTSVN